MADVTTRTGAQVWLADAAERSKVFGYIRVDVPTLEAIQKLADERDRLREALEFIRPALPVLQNMMSAWGLNIGALKAIEMRITVDGALGIQDGTVLSPPSGDTPAGGGAKLEAPP